MKRWFKKRRPNSALDREVDFNENYFDSITDSFPGGVSSQVINPSHDQTLARTSITQPRHKNSTRIQNVSPNVSGLRVDLRGGEDGNLKPADKTIDLKQKATPVRKFSPHILDLSS